MKLLILSDIHGNWPALEAVIREEGTWDAVAFCGDLVDYGPHPARCLHWVADHVEHAVRGNHDNAVGFWADCRCMGSFRSYSVITRSWHQGLLATSDRNFLSRLPTLHWFTWQGQQFRMGHATPEGDLFEYLPMDQWGERTEGLAADFVLLGHTHIQGMRRYSGLTVVNPGSVGLARDRGGEACYAVFDGTRMVLKRIPYDLGQTLTDLRRAPLPAYVIEGLERALRTGSVPHLEAS